MFRSGRTYKIYRYECGILGQGELNDPTDPTDLTGVCGAGRPRSTGTAWRTRQATAWTSRRATVLMTENAMALGLAIILGNRNSLGGPGNISQYRKFNGSQHLESWIHCNGQQCAPQQQAQL